MDRRYLRHASGLLDLQGRGLGVRLQRLRRSPCEAGAVATRLHDQDVQPRGTGNAREGAAAATSAGGGGGGDAAGGAVDRRPPTTPVCVQRSSGRADRARVGGRRSAGQRFREGLGASRPCGGAWGPGHSVSDRAVDSHVRRIRSKLRAAGGDPIETVHGLGYRPRGWRGWPPLDRPRLHGPTTVDIGRSNRW